MPWVFQGVVAIVAGIRMNKPSARAAWWLFAAGQFLFFSGDLYTYSYRLLFGVDVTSRRPATASTSPSTRY